MHGSKCFVMSISLITYLAPGFPHRMGTCTISSGALVGIGTVIGVCYRAEDDEAIESRVERKKE